MYMQPVLQEERAPCLASPTLLYCPAGATPLLTLPLPPRLPDASASLWNAAVFYHACNLLGLNGGGT